MLSLVTPQQEEGWKHLYEEGLSIRDIAEASGFGATCVREHLNKLGVVMRKTIVTPEMVDEWVAAFQDGESISTIAEHSGVNDETIRTHLKKRGIKMRKQGTRSQITPDEEDQWADLYLAGSSVAQIAKQYKVSETTVSVHLRNMGIEMRKGFETNQKVTDEMVNEWIELYNSGLGTPQIAKRYKVTSTTVLKYLHDYGIQVSRAINDDISGEITKRYTQGESVHELAEAYSLSDTSIRNHLKKNGIRLRKENRGYYQISENEISDWVKRYESGEPLASIALSAGIKSTEPVRKRLVERGVEIRSKISPSTSSAFPEWAFIFYLTKIFPDCTVENNASLELESGVVHPDVLVIGDSIQNHLSGTESYKGLIIEYDGEHWHDNPEQRRLDEAKTKRMSGAGYYVVRILENSQGVNDCSDPHRILCTSERSDKNSGLGFAIASIFRILGQDPNQVNLIKDTEEISRLYYAARNKATQYDEWVDLYQMGISSIEIADRFETTPTTVTKHLKALGIKIRHKSYDQEARNKWLELYEQGMEVSEIALQEQVDKGVIYRYLNALGISFDRTVLRPRAYDLEWKELYESGSSLACIAKRYGVSAGQVKSHLEKMGVQIRAQIRPTISTQDVDHWVLEYKNGATLEELAKASRVGSTTIRSRLIERGVRLRSGAPNKTSDDVLNQMAAMYKTGLTPKEIGKQLGLSHSAVCRNLKAKGFNVVFARSVTEDELDEWVELYESGMNINELAARSGFNRNTISKRLQSRGVILRSGGRGNSSGRVSEDMVKEWIVQYESGTVLKKIAEQYGVSETTVKNHLKKHGVKMRSGGRSKAIKRDK